jgi:hypothetical protein
MTKSTIIFLQGGLGNQLFQYAAGLALTEYNKSKLYLTPSEYNKHSGRDYRQKIYIRSIPINTNQTKYIEHQDPFQSWCPDDYTNIDHLRLKGYFQYLPAIESQILIIKNDILNIFLNIREELIKKYKIINKKDLYFIHVRRNDYLVQPENTLYIQDKTYYLNSIKPISGGYFTLTNIFVYFHITHSSYLMPVDNNENHLDQFLQAHYEQILSTYKFNRNMRSRLH